MEDNKVLHLSKCQSNSLYTIKSKMNGGKEEIVDTDIPGVEFAQERCRLEKAKYPYDDYDVWMVKQVPVKLSRAEEVYLERVALRLIANGITHESLNEQSIEQAGREVLMQDEALFHMTCGSQGKPVAMEFMEQMGKRVYEEINSN